MIKKIKTMLTSLVAASALLVPVMVPVTVAAATDIQGNLCGGAEIELGSRTCAASTAESDVEDLVETIINIMSAVVAIVAVIMIIIGGFRYVLSGGNDSNVASAKNTIIMALVGLVIVALAQVIVRFVLSRVTD